MKISEFLVRKKNELFEVSSDVVLDLVGHFFEVRKAKFSWRQHHVMDNFIEEVQTQRIDSFFLKKHVRKKSAEKRHTIGSKSFNWCTAKSLQMSTASSFLFCFDFRGLACKKKKKYARILKCETNCRFLTKYTCTTGVLEANSKVRRSLQETSGLLFLRVSCLEK